MARLHSLAWFLCVVAIGCSDPPSEVTTDPSDPGTSTGPGPATTNVPLDTTAGDTEVATGNGDTGTGAVDTTEGVTATDTGVTDPSTSGESSSSGGPPPECTEPDDCDSNETCDSGSCVAACNAWGPSNYGDCLTQYGGFDTPTLCGADNLCVYYEVPIQGTTCSQQDCASACDCPGPAPTGNATVTCDDITNDGVSDCYLSCADGETCPDGTVCLTGGSQSFCMTPPSDLPAYGNCGNVDADCVAGTECVQQGGYSVCVEGCFESANCDDAPPDASNDASCEAVIFPPLGLDCHLPCSSDPDCPAGMECFTTDTDGQLCMWPDL